MRAIETMGTIRGIFLVALGLFASVGWTDEKNTLEQVLAARSQAENQLKEKWKAPSFFLTPAFVLENFQDRIEGVYVHYGSQIRFFTREVPSLKMTVTARSVEGNDAFWAAKLKDFVWFQIVFKDKSYILLSTKLNPLEIHDLESKTEMVRRTILQPAVEEGIRREQWVKFPSIDDNYIRLKEPAQGWPLSVLTAPIHGGINHMATGSHVVGIVYSSLVGVPVNPSFSTTEIDAARAATQRTGTRR